MRSAAALPLFGIFLFVVDGCQAYTTSSGRRAFLQETVASAAIALVGASSLPTGARAATPQIFETPKGVKYAVLVPPKEKSPPQAGDLVAIEYTGYLTDGTIFDSTHAEGKKNALVFQVGGNAVIDGINEMVQNMGVGMKVQAIVPPGLAFGEKGLCLEDGECLIKPGATLVYDVTLKRTAIPPP